jgi:hypothetical protein
MLARAIFCALLAGAAPGPGLAQEPAPPAPDATPDVMEVAPAAETPATSGALVTVPALTSLYLRIEEELSSKKNRNGDRFPIAIDEDVRVGPTVVIPAGAVGEGEVIHAAKSGMGGKAGELLVTARFVRIGDREIRLRSFSLGAKGRDRSDDSLALAIVAGPLAMFVVGGVMIIPRGTVASAKTAEPIELPAVQPTVDSTKGGDDE